MKKKLFGLLRTDRRGLALISVLGVVTLATILIMALFSVSDAEYKASKVYAEGNSARHLADSAIAIVQAQIQTAATGGSKGEKPTIWASQPGAVRTYNASGNFIEGRTLFSSSSMVMTGFGPGGEEAFMKGVNPRIDSAWNEKPDQWVDMNQPVLRARSAGGTSNDIEVTFPILDPRVTLDGPSGAAVEGFSYERSVRETGENVPGTVTSGNPDTLRCPMPVEWLYVLKDGTVGTVTAGQGENAVARWESSNGQNPSAENPIVGRIAFWTDDESTKVNVNTAGEPGPWLTPSAYHNRDLGFASFQPVVAETYRFPGHPHTVSISTVLNPGFKWDTYTGYPPRSMTSESQFKMQIYGLLPRMEPGGTSDGTLPFDRDDFIASTSMALDWNKLQRERLYTSVDEFLFSNRYLDNTRVPNQLQGLNNRELIDPVALNRAKFFLTASSSSPETNMFSYPRVAIWPLPDKQLGAAFRQGNDSAMEISATLGVASQSNQNVYAFRRSDADSALTDAGTDSAVTADVVRNAKLLSYLNALMNSEMPGGGSFGTKYPGDGNFSDQKQILVQIFDYIRCTNLFDNYLNERSIQSFGLDYRDGNRLDAATVYRETPKFGRFYTYTEPRFEVTRRAGNVYGLPTNRRAEFTDENVVTGAYPGHGQVRPIEWTPADSAGQTYKGFGRFPTISEVALHFICTGDGLNTVHSHEVRKTASEIVRSGGLVAQKIDQTIANERFAVTKNSPRGVTWDRWFSNFPPFPNAQRFRDWGCDFQRIYSGFETDPSLHPAWNAANWNCTLDYNEDSGGVPLRVDEKRIQLAILLETFIPAAGWTKYVPDWTIVMKGEDINGITVTNSAGNDQSLFDTTGDQALKSTFAYIGGAVHGMNEGDNVYALGGAYGTGAMLNGRRVKGVGRMPKDPNYYDQATDDIHADMNNLTLVSNFVTVRRDEDIKFRVLRPLRFEIYSSHDWQGSKDKKGSTPVQTFEVEFPRGDQTTPTPDLVLYSTELIDRIDENGNSVVQPAIHAVRWWTFNYGGAVNRYVGTGTEGGSTAAALRWDGVRENIEGNVNQRGTIAGDRTWGRLHGEPHAAVNSKHGKTGTVAVGQGRNISRSARIPTSGLIYGFNSANNFNGVGSWLGIDNRSAYITGNGLLQASSGGGAGGRIDMGTLAWFGTDSIRSMIPRSGDYRLIAARKVVPKESWEQHPVWKNNPGALFAHNITSFSSNSQAGADFGDVRDPTIPDATNRLVSGAWYPQHQIPDIPLTDYASKSAAKYGDWDNGSGVLRDGAYINKPDDGNLSVMKLWHGGKSQGIYRIRNAYFTQSWLQVPSREAFFSPNRLTASPGVFGSLPTGVFGSRRDTNETVESQIGAPWRTLLFRPDVGVRQKNGGQGVGSHPGAAQSSGGGGPPDHLIMDLFWMPVIDPRPMSLGFATEGKINMNYQMLPFRHINRATGMHAALKGEFVTAYAQQDTRTGGTPSNNNPAIYKTAKDTSVFPNLGWSEATPDGKDWYRHINIPETLEQFREKFEHSSRNPSDFGGLLKTASQICEMHMIPAGAPRHSEPVLVNLRSMAERRNKMGQFWASNRLTGDNTKERLYANLYQKVTTKSNAFRVYFRAQSISKARSLQPNEVDTTRDTVTAEYQGSALIQRYLDMSKFTDYPDYASVLSSSSLFAMRSLEHYYRYRVLEMKQFAP